MLIPIRCFTCNCIIADKWNYYRKLVELYREESPRKESVVLNVDNIRSLTTDSTPEYKALHHLKISRMCCRRHFLTTVDLMEKI